MCLARSATAVQRTLEASTTYLASETALEMASRYLVNSDKVVPLTAAPLIHITLLAVPGDA